MDKVDDVKVGATKGPWRAVEPTGDDAWQVVPDDEDEFRVCTVTQSRLHAEANARLIASAPELLEALKRIVTLLEERGHVWDVNETGCASCLAHGVATKAIAKAEGRE